MEANKGVGYRTVCLKSNASFSSCPEICIYDKREKEESAEEKKRFLCTPHSARFECVTDQINAKV